MLAPAGSLVASAALSERYVAWTGYSVDPPSYGKDVFLYDLQTGESAHVEASYPAWQYELVMWDDYLLWDESDDLSEPPYRLVLYRMSTGQKTVLTTESILLGYGIDKGLVVYNTGQYDQANASVYHKDIEIYEIATGLTRRLTTKPSSVGVSTTISFSNSWPYLFFSTILPLDENRPPGIFVANLIALDVTDDQGNLLPGDPVIEPPGP